MAAVTGVKGIAPISEIAEVTSVKGIAPNELCKQLDEIQNKVAETTGSLIDLEDSKKRWLLIGTCLHTIISPVLRKYVEPRLDQLWQTLMNTNNIDNQVYKNQLKSHNGTYLNYETINDNKMKWGRQQDRYDYQVKNYIDLSKLFLDVHTSQYTAFDDKCDATALLGILIKSGICSTNGKVCAEKVRSEIRNPWAHCNLGEWDETKYNHCSDLMKDLVKRIGLSNEEEIAIIGQLDRWNQNGKQFIDGTTVECIGFTEIKTQVQLLVQTIAVIPEQIMEMKNELTDVEQRLTDQAEISLLKSQETEQSIRRLEKRIDEQEWGAPERIKEIFQIHIEGWKRDEKTFTVTRATKYVTKLIEEKNVIVITGSSGSGKSSLINHVALELNTKEGYDIIPFITCPADIINYRDIKKNQVFVIDDICGKNFINEQDLRIWNDQADNIQKLFPSENIDQKDIDVACKETINGHMKILVSCRLHIFKDDKFKSLKMFTKHFCDLQSESHCLLPEERLKMITKYTSNLSVEVDKRLLVKKLDKYHYFPLLCKMSIGKTMAEVTELLSSPIDSIKKDIKIMIESNQCENCVLVLCVLFHYGFDERYMNLSITPRNVKNKVKK